MMTVHPTIGGAHRALRIPCFSFLICAMSWAVPLSIKAQTMWADSLSIKAQTSVSVSTSDEFNPLWLYSGEWGRYTQYNQAEGMAGFDAQMNIFRSRNVSVVAGVGAYANANLKNSYLHNAYVAGRAWMIDFEVGMRPHSPLAQNDDVTSGRILFSSNARPQPRIGIGIYDWWSIPYTHNWLQVKAACYVGRLMNEDVDSFTRNAITHDKFAYGRLGGWYLKPYIGLFHSVLMGGTHPTLGKMPTDFWASFWGEGSEKFRDIEHLRGEATNAAGAHMGMWTLGADLDLPFGSFSFYFDKVFSDNAGIHLKDNMQDHVIGVVGTLKNKYVHRVGIEWFDTDYEGGDGVNDPTGVDIHGENMTVFPGDMGTSDFRNWLLGHFHEEDIVKWEKDMNLTITTEAHATVFMRDYWGNGRRGGRKTYLHNYLYKQGWSYNGLSSGTPLYHSYRTVDKYRHGEGAVQNMGFFTNTRVIALTLGVAGTVNDKLNYRIKYTYSRNHGSRQEKFIFGTMDTIKDYYYTDTKDEQYFMLDLNYSLSNNLCLRGTLAIDDGDLYNATGLRLGLSYTLNKNR